MVSQTTPCAGTTRAFSVWHESEGVVDQVVVSVELSFASHNSPNAGARRRRCNPDHVRNLLLVGPEWVALMLLDVDQLHRKVCVGAFVVSTNT